MFIVHHAAGVDLDELLHLVPHPRPVLVEEPVDMDEGGHCIVHTEIPHQTQTTFFPQFLQLEELCKLEDLHCVLVEVGRDGATVQVPQQDLNGQGARGRRTCSAKIIFPPAKINFPPACMALI